METIMSTLTLPGATAAPAAPRTAPGLLLERLLAARVRQAEDHIRLYLVRQSGARLAALGFGAAEIAALRQGRLQLPIQKGDARLSFKKTRKETPTCPPSSPA
jgi:hypothetical protein